VFSLGNGIHEVCMPQVQKFDTSVGDDRKCVYATSLCSTTTLSKRGRTNKPGTCRWSLEF
jgi:hypothetical protein